MNLINKALGAFVLGLSLASSLVSSAEMEDTITVTSTAFENHGTVPLKHSAYGENLSPQLTWSNLPAGTVQLALVMDDPIAPTPEPFVHWVAYNIPAAASGLPEARPSASAQGPSYRARHPTGPHRRRPLAPFAAPPPPAERKSSQAEGRAWLRVPAT